VTHRTIITAGFARAALLLALSGAAGCEGPDGSTTEGAASPTAETSTGGSTGAGSTGAATTGDAGTTTATTGESTTGGPATSDDGGGPASTGAAVDPCEDSVLTWEDFGEPFMSTWCTSCHHSSLPLAHRAKAPCSVNFDRHGDVKFWASRVLDRAVTMAPTPMPPAAIIPWDELALLEQYLECGAPGPDLGDTFSMCPDPP
jgi:hypothetical protein